MQGIPGIRRRSHVRFSKNLHEWRTVSGKKLIESAREFGVSPATWGHWETGRRFPSGSNLRLLARYTGMSVQCLICDHGKACWRFPPRGTQLPRSAED